MKPITFTIPVKTVAGDNQREHWAVKARRVKSQRTAAFSDTLKAIGGYIYSVKKIRVTLCRISPRKLDGWDNYRASLKHIVDGIADVWVKRDDHKFFEWAYADQEKGKSAVRVTIEEIP